MEKTREHGSFVAHMEKGEVVERCWIDPATWDYVVEVRRLDGSLTEERVSIVGGGSQWTPDELDVLKRIGPAGA